MERGHGAEMVVSEAKEVAGVWVPMKVVFTVTHARDPSMQQERIYTIKDVRVGDVKEADLRVPFAPGALTDVAARAIAQELSQQLPQQFVVENRGGAGGTVGTAEVAKAAPDGHTLVFTDSSYMISAALYSKLAYDPLKDLVPVTLAVEAPAIMVARPGLPAQSLRDVVTLAKARPRTLTYGSGG